MDNAMETLLLSLGLAALETGISALASVGKPVPPEYLELRKQARKALVDLAGEEAGTSQLEPDPAPAEVETSEGESGGSTSDPSSPSSSDPSDDELSEGSVEGELEASEAAIDTTPEEEQPERATD